MPIHRRMGKGLRRSRRGGNQQEKGAPHHYPDTPETRASAEARCVCGGPCSMWFPCHVHRAQEGTKCVPWARNQRAVLVMGRDTWDGTDLEGTWGTFCHDDVLYLVWVCSDQVRTISRTGGSENLLSVW